jgi:glycosyltransferase involved in cell wall biosynthesis
LGGGTDEIIQDQLSGFLISPSNPTELASKVELLLNDESMRHRMGKHGKVRIQESFTIEDMVSKYIMEYKKILIVQ